MLKNLCRIRYRNARRADADWIELKINHANASFESSSSNTDAGILYTYKIAAVIDDDAVYLPRYVIVQCFLDNGKVATVGSSEYPATNSITENIDTISIQFACTTPLPAPFVNQ